ncbi:BRCT domain-containing protein [uncultured Microscilla sp.]|uniref:leucine-rich repeat domain-containing protein n=1 Tax=uncultured Microscilla sp. TaxID=432653 RepID=UPI002618491B|nr:BRCT domain-containing protein [uncultured Microscilla sp.]
MRKSNYHGFQTLPFTFPVVAAQTPVQEFTSISQAIKAIAKGVTRVRLVLSRKRLQRLPSNINSLAKAPYLEIDLSDNPGLHLKQALKTLSTLPQLKALDLSGMRMGTLPPEIGLLASLEQLILYSNALDELPQALENLRYLCYLNLHSNNIRDLSVVYALPQLQKLILRGNSFSKKEFYQIGKLKQLKCLDMRRCGVTRIPEEFTQLTQLQSLDASANHIRQLPESFGRLTALQNIDLRMNGSLNWDNVFAQLAQLPQLIHLDLSQYNLQELSPKVSAMKQLRVLNIQSNLLTRLPATLANLSEVEEIKVQYNMELDWQQALEVLGKVTSLKRLVISEVNNATALPDTLGNLHNIESLTIERMPLLQQLPAAMGKLNNLRCLHIHYCPKLTHLPEVLDKLTLLKVLDISNMNPKFTQLPSTLTKLTSLEKLCLSGNNIAQLPRDIGRLLKLHTLWVGDALQELPKEIAHLNQLEELYLGNAVLWQLPEEVATLACLRVLDFGKCAQLDLEHTFDLLKALKHVRKIKIGHRKLDALPDNIAQLDNIEEVDLTTCELTALPEVITVLAKMPALTTLRVKMNHSPLPASMSLLAHLHTIQVDYPINYLYRHEQPIGGIPLEWGLFEHTHIESNSPYFDKTNRFIAQYGNENYPKERRMFFFGVYTGNFESLLQRVDNHLKKSSFKPERSVFFVTGKVSGFTQKELKEKLVEYGIQVSNKITPRVTHAVIGRFTKPALVAQIFALPIAIVLEDYLKDFIWAQDKPYLMKGNVAEMSRHVLDLFMSDDEDNFKLALQIIEGGGASRQIITYLMVISLFYPDNEVRKESRRLFKKYASSELQEHVRKHWNIALRQKVESYYLNPLIDHPEVNAGEFMVMRIRVSWAGGNAHRVYMKERINLSRVSFSRLPKSLVYLGTIRKIVLTDNPSFDFDQALEVLNQLPHLEELSLANCSLTAVPKGVYTLKKLKKLNLSYNQLTHLSGGFSQLSQLEELVLDNNPLQQVAPDFYRLPQLKKLSIQNGKLTKVPTEIEQMPQLHTLLLNNNQISDLPESIGKLVKLQDVQLFANHLKYLPASLGKLRNLNRISLKNNQLKALPEELHWKKIYKLDLSGNQLVTLPESIANCSYLNEIKLNNNQISFLPNSLNNLSVTYFSIDLSNNDLTELPEVIPQIKQLRNLNISENKLTALPSELCQVSELYYLRVNNNQITHLPQGFSRMIKLNNIDFSYNQIQRLPDQLPPVFHDKQAYRGNFMLYGNPVSFERKKKYMQKFHGLRF